MTFRDERLDLVNYDTIMGQAMRKPRTVEHEELAAQMSEWERTHTVTVYASGTSSSNTPPPPKEKKEFNNAPRKNSSTSASGYLNITIDTTGAYVANVSRTHLGSFKTVEEAVAVRDRHRKAHGMPPAEDAVCSGAHGIL